MVDGDPFTDIKCLQDACKIKWFEGRESGEPSRVSFLESGGNRRSCLVRQDSGGYHHR